MLTRFSSRGLGMPAMIVLINLKDGVSPGGYEVTQSTAERCV
jgi:hypothetical protein